MTRLKKWRDQTSAEVYTLISNHTASAALMMAVDSGTELDSILAGEPTCQRPNFNGHMARKKLGDTSLELQYSTLYIKTLEDGDLLRMLEPDILIPQTMEDWKEGVDTAVNVILSME